MTKKDLLKALEKVGDDKEIGINFDLDLSSESKKLSYINIISGSRDKIIFTASKIKMIKRELNSAWDMITVVYVGAE
ncbi:MAG: hypothetical protein WC319_15450 [Candidatus Paceibacterota bacterium]|jgi:hypothetical protein